VLVIQDEQLAKQLQAIAEQEHRPVEAVLKSLLDRYPQTPAASPDYDADEAIKQVRRKAYAKARVYWEANGDMVKANLTDAELDEQFWLFDSDGIPRLKSEQGSVELLPGTFAWLSTRIDEISFETPNPIEPSEVDNILNAEFADYLLKRMEDGSATNSDR